MAHYALLSDNVVVNVFSGRDEDDLPNGVDDWETYYAPEGFTVKRTSYNTRADVHVLGNVPFRKNFAEVGGVYDETRDAFLPPQPAPDWVLDEETCTWIDPNPPVLLEPVTEEATE